MLMILIFAASLAPAVLVFLWLRKRKAGDGLYREICNRALGRGAVLCAALVLVVSGVLYGGALVLRMLGVGAVARAVYYNFIVLALAEELVKYRVMRGLLKKHPYPYSWLDVTTMMMIVGIGFELTESVAYAIGANAGMMLVRGFTAMHCGYGFIMGYFVGKGMKTGQKKYTCLGILVPFLLHGAYDCCLSEELGAISESFGVVSLALAAVAVVTLLVAIVHVRRAGKQAEYTEALEAGTLPAEALSAETSAETIAETAE